MLDDRSDPPRFGLDVDRDHSTAGPFDLISNFSKHEETEGNTYPESRV